MASDDIVQEIKDRIDIVDVISRYVTLERAGRRMRARCPFHEETEPSFYVDPAGGFWKCFGCGAGGDVFSFLQKIEGLSFPEAGERLAEMVGLEWKSSPRAKQKTQEKNLVRQANEYATEFFRQKLQGSSAAGPRKYLLDRGISAESIEKFGLGYAPDSWDAMLQHLTGRGIQPQVAEKAGLVKPRATGGYYDTFRNRIIFPIQHVSGYTVGFGGRALDPEEAAKYINSPETPLFKKSRTVYGLNHARQMINDRDMVIVVEGYTDVISVSQAGIENVVACLGTATTADHLNLLGRYADEIVFIYDADAAGMQAALRHIDVFEAAAADVKVGVLPEGTDPDEAVRNLGPEAFMEIVERRMSLVEYQLRMIFEEYGGQTGGDRAAAARDAVKVLAKVQDRARCDAFLAQAADWWGQSNPARTEAMERVLTEELKKLVGSRRRSRRVPLSARDKQFISDAVVHVAERRPRGLLKNEAELLCAAMNHRELAEVLCSRMEPPQCIDGVNAVVLGRLAEHLQAGGEYQPQEVIDELPEEDGVRQRAIELWLRPDPYPEDDEDEPHKQESPPTEITPPTVDRKTEFAKVVGQHIANVKRYRTQTDLQEQRRSIAEAIDRGELTPDSPEYQEYIRRHSEIAGLSNGGGGTEGFWGVDSESKKDSVDTDQHQAQSPSDEGS